MAVLVNPATGQAFEVADDEADGAIASMDLVRATPEQVAYLERQRAEAAKPLGQKALETSGTFFTGVSAINTELGKLIPESLGGMSPEEIRQSEEFQRSQKVQDLAEAHPVARSLGVGVPAFAVSGAIGGIGGMLAESAAVGLSEEAVNRTAEGREFDLGEAAGIAGQDFAFSALAHAATQVAGRVGNLFLFGTGNTMARNVKRGLDETAEPVVPDDLRFEGPLLEAETRSRRAAAAASPGMPPGPERDELLRRSARDLEQQVESQGGEMFERTAGAARESASVAGSERVQRRVDDFLTETTPAQTAWSADATRKLDEMRSTLAAAIDEPLAAPFVARAQEAADEAIRAIDGSGDSAAWFQASARARDRLDSLLDDLADSDLPEAGAVARSISDARDYLARNLADRALFGTAAEVDATLRGAARDRIGAAVRSSGGDLRAQLSAFVAADAAERAALRAPLEQAIEGFEELAAAHERFGTATPKAIETLRENAATLRRGLTLADDVRAAESRAPARTQARAEATQSDFSRAQTLSEQIARKAARKVAQGVVDYASGPGRAVYDDAVSDALKGAIQSAAAIGGLAAFGPVGFAAGWLGARSLGNRYAPEVGKSILEAAQRYVSKHGADTAGLALLGTAALGGDEGDEGSDAAAASAGGLLFARRFARRALEATGDAARAAGRGVYRASEAVTGAVDSATGKATDALARGSYKAGRAAGETVGRGGDAVASAFADETRAKRVVGSATRAAMSAAMSAAMGPLGWAGREIRHEAGRAMADFFGPRISRRAVEWLERRSGKTTAETVQDAVTETVEAARREPLLLPEHTEQAGAMTADFADQLRRSGAETAEDRAAALAAFPKRLGGDAHVQRELLASSVKDLVASLGKVSDPGAAEAAQAFAELANSAIVNARTVQDRFRIGMQLTQTLAEHTALAGDGEMAKVFGAHTEKMWEMMGQREIWMGSRELEREAKRASKRRASLLSRLSDGEKLGVAAVGGAAALDDEDDGAAMAGAGALAALLGRRGLNLARHKLTPRSAREILQLGAKLPPGGKDVGPGGALGAPGVGAATGAGPIDRVRAPVGSAQVEPGPGIPAPAPAGVKVSRDLPPIPTDDVFSHLPSVARKGILAERLSGPKGVTPGGFFRGDDGVVRYVKVDPNPVRARREASNIAMYNALGVRTPELELVDLPGGLVALASKHLGEQWKPLNRVDDLASLPQSVRDSYAELVPINLIMGNWDVAGNPGNVMTDGRVVLMVDAGEAGANRWTRDWVEKKGNYGLTRYEIDRTIRSAHGDTQAVRKGAPHSLLEPYADSEGQLQAIAQRGFDRAMAVIEESGGPHAFIRNHSPDLTEQEVKRAGDEMKVRIDAVKLAIPALAAMVWVAFSPDEAEAAEPDERTFAANRIVSIDDAATRRIKHTARVLSGLAEPPSPEGLTTALGRFGAEHDDPRAAFEERKAILQKADLAPALVYDVIGATLGDVARVSPEVFQAAAARLLDGFRYMRENLPPEVKASLLYPTGLPPSESAMRDWATQWNTVMDPESVLDDIERGTVTHLQIDTLEGAHPDLYQQLRTEIIAEVGANFADIPTATKMQLDILFGADGLAGPMFSSEAAAMIGAAGRAASRRKQPGPADASATDAQAASGPSGIAAIKSSVTNRSSA